MRLIKRAAWLALLLACLVVAQSTGRLDRYALVLEDPRPSPAPLTAKPGGQLAIEAAASAVAARQAQLKAQLAQQGIHILGSSRILVNAVYVRATAEQARQLARLPGVRGVVRLRAWRRHMSRALDIVRAPAAWPTLGGSQNAGAGVKIAILDTGIDQTHPAFHDPTLTPPAGYPKCLPRDCAYTNRKVIVARSYVDLLVLPDQPEWSRPDDLSPRDHVGHGTATAMIAAGVPVETPLGRLSGIAPKAYLGNYKIFGSPGVNDLTFDDVIIQALEDALLDGMDIAVLAAGQPADWGPADQGPDCNLPTGQACDLRAAAVEEATRLGLTVIVSAGNDGDVGLEFPALSTVHSPGTAPSAITVGALTNAHELYVQVRVNEPDAPSNIRVLRAMFGDGPKPPQPIQGPLVDLAQWGPLSTACSALEAGSLAGAIALVDRGECSFATKINNAQRAGAIAVIVAQYPGLSPFPMLGTLQTGIPAVMIGGDDARALRNYLHGRPRPAVVLDPNLIEFPGTAGYVAYFSSRGPATGEGGIKPEVVAIGTDLYVATQDYDPNGELWSPQRYTAAQGTSFAAPMVAGAVALLKQRYRELRPSQYKSLIVNTANPDVRDWDSAGSTISASVVAQGGGRLDVQAALSANVTVEPATLSFGYLEPNRPLPTRTLTFTNLSSQALTLTLSVEPSDPRVRLARTSLQLPPGGSEQVGVELTSLPPAGLYQGVVRVAGGSVPLRIPYLYLRGDGVPFNLIPLSGHDFLTTVNERVPGNLLVKVVDRYGVPVSDLPVQFEPADRIEWATRTTDRLGIAEASAFAGPNPGELEFVFRVPSVADLSLSLRGRARLRPVINQGGVVNAASSQLGPGIAPGSYISIYGSNLSEATRAFSTPYLPWSLAGVSVSFDVPGRGLSFPGRLSYVSPTQINVQVPWELQGFSTVLVKVSLDPLTSSALYQVPVATYAPAFFEIQDLGGSGRLMAAAVYQQPGTGNVGIVSSSNPAHPGWYVQLYLNGLGPVNDPPPSGEPAPLDRRVWTQERPVVRVAGREVPVLFHGLAPGFVGLYQVNIQLPDDLPSGWQTLDLSIGGVSAKQSFLYVER